MKENLINVLGSEKIFPIIRNDDPEMVINTAKALADGGIKVLEINIQNPKIYCAIREASKFVSVCAGGIITSLQAQAAIDAGADILSSPIFQMNMVKLSKDKRIPFIAGASTANEAYAAWKARIPLIKIFPVTSMGGVMYIKDMLRPMQFLNVIPSGNVRADEVKSYINAGAFAVGVGRDLYEGYSLKEITERTKRVVEELKG